MNQPFAAELAGQVARMYRVALRIVGCPDAAQEVAQEACVKALRGGEEFAGRSSAATWLHRITVNCAHDHLRKSRRLARGRTDWDRAGLGTLAQFDATPAECAERGELYRIAIGLIAELPDDCRSAFVLTQLDGCTYDEAAAIEELSRGTVASRVHRARKILMERIDAGPAGETS
jgi:RNA polymerase sigma-70 factor (ECF subfamily)